MITNSRALFLVNIGFIHAGADFHSREDVPIVALVDEIHLLKLPADVTAWFHKARTGQVEVNPFYPRGSDLAAACFFLQDGKLNIDAYYSFLAECGTNDPIGASDFRGWIEQFTEILSVMLSLPDVIPLWHKYETIVADRSGHWREMISTAQSALHTCYDKTAPNLIFCPNLFNQYLADFVRQDHQLIVIASEPNMESMLHEALHPLFAACRDLFVAYAEKNGIALFADEAAMLKMGYMADTLATSTAHVLEECFVRALSVALSGCESARIAFHRDCGFRLTPYLAEQFGEIERNHVNILQVVKLTLNAYSRL
jgi:hypothetical protein